MGYISWGFCGYTKETVPALNGRGVNGEAGESDGRAGITMEVPRTKETLVEERTEQALGARGRPKEAKPILIEEATEGDRKSPITRLTAIIDADMKQWQSIFMPEGSKCMFVVGLSVAPAYSGLGVGSALLRCGKANADADGVFFWLHSPESAHTFYAKEGFQTVGPLDIDLDEFAPGPPNEEGGDGKWGHYVFRYMKRLPLKQDERLQYVLDWEFQKRPHADLRQTSVVFMQFRA